MTLIAVLDYGIGNLRSAQKALEHVGADARLTDDPALVRDADGVVLPGVGSFGRCMEALRETGLADVAIESVERGQPFLGICVGLQLLYEWSEEAPGVPGLGVLPGEVRWLAPTVTRPQMQWNTIDIVVESAMFEGMSDPAWVYFVHSLAADDTTHVVATCDYGGAVCAAVERDNLFATQFHPEKSSTNGLRLLANFVTRSGASRPAGVAP